MTTSHRPQLEARSGAKAAAYTPTGIEHARLLPGHTTLKYRKFKEEENLRANCAQEDRSNDKSLEEAVVNEEKQDVVGSGNLQETRSEKDQKDSLPELLVTQKNKVEDKAELEGNEQLKGGNSSRRSWRKGTAFGRHKVTKETNIKEHATKKSASGYINDMTKSEYHQEFLHKHVR